MCVEGKNKVEVEKPRSQWDEHRLNESLTVGRYPRWGWSQQCDVVAISSFISPEVGKLHESGLGRMGTARKEEKRQPEPTN